MWYLKHKMFQERDVQNMKRFKHVTYKKNDSETWHLKLKCLNMNGFRNVTFKTWYFIQTWRSKHEMFQKHDIQTLKCFRTVTFWTFVLETWRAECISKTWRAKCVSKPWHANVLKTWRAKYVADTWRAKRVSGTRR